eukprot:2755329-Rhodomonas_salina.2
MGIQLRGTDVCVWGTGQGAREQAEADLRAQVGVRVCRAPAHDLAGSGCCRVEVLGWWLWADGVRVCGVAERCLFSGCGVGSHSRSLAHSLTRSLAQAHTLNTLAQPYSLKFTHAHTHTRSCRGGAIQRAGQGAAAEPVTCLPTLALCSARY